jgi:hypothetical protein
MLCLAGSITLAALWICQGAAVSAPQTAKAPQSADAATAMLGKPNSLGFYQGEAAAANITTISGEEGATALAGFLYARDCGAYSFQPKELKQRWYPIRDAFLVRFQRATIANLKRVDLIVSDQERNDIIQAAEMLDAGYDNWTIRMPGSVVPTVPKVSGAINRLLDSIHNHKSFNMSEFLAAMGPTLNTIRQHDGNWTSHSVCALPPAVNEGK